MSDIERANKIVSELHTRFPGILEHFREVLTRKIVEVLCEAHERGRKDGLEVAIQTILAEARFQEDQRSLKESIVLRNVAESIRTAMEGKDGE